MAAEAGRDYHRFVSISFWLSRWFWFLKAPKEILISSL